MDLTKLSDNDLMALQSGDLTKVSDAGLMMLQGGESAPKSKPGVLESFGAGLGSGVGNVALSAQNIVGKGLAGIGADQVGQWLQRDAAMGKEKLKGEVAPYKEANPMTAGGGELAGEIASTLPVGGGLAKGLSLIPGAAQKAAPLLQAIRTSGGAGGNVATRAAGGALTGGASAALINEDSVGTGAIIGGALPVIGATASKLFSGPQSDDLAKAVLKAREAGYVIPPTQANPSLTNRLLEGYSGKLTTAQNASAKNQAVTNKLAAKALGLSDDTQLTPEVLEGIRAQAGKAYDALASLPVKEGSVASSLMNTPGAAKIDPRQMVYDLRVARNNSTAYYNSYGRSADPEALAKAQAFKKEASQIESALENYAKSIGHADLVPALRDARQLIAKTYTVEKALNSATGSVNAQKLAAQLDKGKPLSGELKDVAQFAQRFKTASKTPESMGSLPQVSPLDFVAGLGAAGVSQYTDNPLFLGLAAGRPVARALALSPIVQNRLAKNPNDINQLLELLRTTSPAMATQMLSD